MIRIDYKELIQTLRKSEMCKVALGSGRGENKVQTAISEVLSYNDIGGASRALVFIKGRRELSLDQTQE